MWERVRGTFREELKVGEDTPILYVGQHIVHKNIG